MPMPLSEQATSRRVRQRRTYSSLRRHGLSTCVADALRTWTPTDCHTPYRFASSHAAADCRRKWLRSEPTERPYRNVLASPFAVQSKRSPGVQYRRASLTRPGKVCRVDTLYCGHSVLQTFCPRPHANPDPSPRTELLRRSPTPRRACVSTRHTLRGRNASADRPRRLMPHSYLRKAKACNVSSQIRGVPEVTEPEKDFACG